MAEGKLILVATPIGNLGDFSSRAVETLKEADLIAAEDTRNSIKLLNHFDIHTPMTAYHEFNRFEKAEELVSKMLEGQTVACITDAGTPGISDPGEELVKQAIEAGIEVTAVPGPSACINALVISGLPTGRFSFAGFLPREKKAREALLSEWKERSETVLFHEAPHRLKKTLEDLLRVFGDRKIALCRELTKKHEAAERTTIGEALRKLETEAPRGEYVLVVAGKPEKERAEAEKAEWQALSIPEHVRFYEKQGFDRKEAMKKVALDRGIPKREVYRALVDSGE